MLQFVSAFAKGKVKGNGNNSQIQPVGDGDLRNNRAVQNTDQKTGNKNGNVYDRNVL